MPQAPSRNGLTPARARELARAARSARKPSDLALAMAQRASMSVIGTRERAAEKMKSVLRSLLLPVDPYDGDQVGEFTTAAARQLGAAQKATATAAAAGQIQLLSAMGVRVKVQPSAPIDVRAAGATFTAAGVDLDHGGVSVRYVGQEPVHLSAADMTTVEVLNRPFRKMRYLESQGATREQALQAGFVRLDSTIDANLMLSQRLAESEVINAAAHLDGSPVVGMRRIIHPELSLTGTCGLCIAASDRLYTVRELLPMHRHCKCTSAPVTEEFDPADQLNAVDLRSLYRDAGGTSRAHLKRTRYKQDDHGELGPTLKPERNYKPRGKAGPVGGPGTGTVLDETPAEVARRQLPLFEANLAKLRADGLPEDSAQVKYHKEQIAKYRERITAADAKRPATVKQPAPARKGVESEQKPSTAPGSGGNVPPAKPPNQGPATSGNSGDDWSEEERARRQAALGIDTHGEDLHQHEIEFVERFHAAGERLEWIPNVRFKPTNDFKWLGKGGSEFELKSTKARYATIHGRILDAASRAAKHNVVKDKFVIDLGNEPLTDELRAELATYNVDRRKYRLAALWVMSQGKLHQIDLDK